MRSVLYVLRQNVFPITTAFIPAPDPFLDSTEPRGVIWIHDHMRHADVQRASHLRNLAVIETPAIIERANVLLNKKEGPPAFSDFAKKLRAVKLQRSRQLMMPMETFMVSATN